LLYLTRPQTLMGMIMQTTWLQSFLSSNPPEQERPTFCPKHVNIKTLGTVDKMQKQARILRTTFSENSLDDVKILQDKYYSHIITNQLESEFFKQDPPFCFTFDDSMFLFLWTIDHLRQDPTHHFCEGSINEDRIELWRSLLKHAERLYNDFVEVFPYLDKEGYASNIRMIALLISMKFYYCDREVTDADFIRAFYLSSAGFEFHKLPEIAQMNVKTMEVGITLYQLCKMEAIFISAIFKHSKKESIHDFKQPDNITANTTRSYGSSSI